MKKTIKNKKWRVTVSVEIIDTVIMVSAPTASAAKALAHKKMAEKTIKTSNIRKDWTDVEQIN